MISQQQIQSKSDQILDKYNQLTKEQHDYIQEKIDECIQLFNEAGHPFAGLERLYTVVDEANKSVAPDASCKAGCAHCCHIRVSCSELEAQLIVHYCREHNIDIDTKKLEKLKDLDQHEYVFSPHKRCTFLSDDNICKVYAVRPMSCRSYYVATPPQYCDTERYPHGRVGEIFDWEQMIPGIALLRVTWDKLKEQLAENLPNQILKALKS